MVGSKVLLNFYATCGESVQPLQSENWYISRAHGQKRLGPSHVYLIEIIALIQLFNVPKLFDYSDIYFFFINVEWFIHDFSK